MTLLVVLKKMPTLEKWMWIYADDDFSGLPLFGCDDDSWQQWPGPGSGPAPGVCVSPRVRTPATTELSLRRPGQFMVSAPAWPAQTFAAGVQRSGDRKCNGEWRRRGPVGERGHSEQAENHASPRQPGRESLISGKISSEAVNNKKISRQSNGGTIKF